MSYICGDCKQEHSFPLTFNASPLCAEALLEKVKAMELQLSEALKYAAPVNATASVPRLKPCEHNEYWTTHSGACMACRATVAERLISEAIQWAIEENGSAVDRQEREKDVENWKYLEGRRLAFAAVINKLSAPEKRVGPACFVCGAEATGKIGAEPRCERHV